MMALSGLLGQKGRRWQEFSFCMEKIVLIGLL